MLKKGAVTARGLVCKEPSEKKFNFNVESEFRTLTKLVSMRVMICSIYDDFIYS